MSWQHALSRCAFASRSAERYARPFACKGNLPATFRRSHRSATSAVAARAVDAARAAAAAVNGVKTPPSSAALHPRWTTGQDLRCAAVAWYSSRSLSVSANPPPPSPAESAAGARGGTGDSRWWRAGSIALRGLALWVPALCFWVFMFVGLDVRSNEEMEEEENEMRRLERFFDVEGLPETEYLAEWDAKEAALGDVVDKLLRSPRFADALVSGLDELIDEAERERADAVSASQKQRRSKQLSPAEADEISNAVEVSYVVPPPMPEDGSGVGAFANTLPSGYPRPWSPHLVVMHRSGAIALLTLTLEYVEKSKDRDERWTCTALRCEVVAAKGGEPAGEPICDLRGALPHGVRYMRIA